MIKISKIYNRTAVPVLLLGIGAAMGSLATAIIRHDYSEVQAPPMDFALDEVPCAQDAVHNPLYTHMHRGQILAHMLYCEILRERATNTIVQPAP